MKYVVLVHGIYDTPAVFTSMRKYLASQGWRVHAPALLPNSGADGLEMLAHQLYAFIEQNIPSDATLHVVGYSMGGLVARYYVQRLGGRARIDCLVTLSTPHNGTYMAYFLPNKGTAQMRPGSAFLEDLNGDVMTLGTIRFVSLWTPWDLTIVPAKSSVLPVGHQVSLPKIMAHPLMLSSQRCHEEVHRWLVS
ncbi:MAG: alpha/beta fold hydrolase [Bacteroidota bacterium]